MRQEALGRNCHFKRRSGDFHNVPDKRHTGPDEGDYVEHGHDWVDVVAVFSYNHLNFG